MCSFMRYMSLGRYHCCTAWQKQCIIRIIACWQDYEDAPSRASYMSAGSGTAGGARGMPGGEETLVEDICLPGGVRGMPEPSDLRRFVDRANGMDGLRIAELLRAKMVRFRGWRSMLERVQPRDG